MKAVADTGFVVALLNRSDKYHEQVARAYRQPDEIILPQTTLAEIAYLLQSRAEQLAVVKFLEFLPSSKLKVSPLIDEDLQMAGRILRQYTGSRIDFVDATVMAVAERLQLQTICTIDRRDFQIYRPAFVPYFTLLPE
jgi:predicted nucleic acid-binding protein